MSFSTISDQFTIEQLIAGQGDKRLVEAYRAVFDGRGTRLDADLVLVDLLQFSRYYTTADINLPADVVKALDQRRAVGERIMEALARTEFDVRGLHSAIMQSEAVALTIEDASPPPEETI